MSSPFPTPDAARRGRVAILTNGNAFAAMGLAELLQAHGTSLEVSVWVTTGMRRNKSNRFKEAWRLARQWGLRYTAYKAFSTLAPYLLQFVTCRPATVSAHCKSRGIPLRIVRNVNEASVVGAIRAFAPDILISFSCPYRIRPELLDLARIGNLNVHSSLLPAYAGVCTYVHVLADAQQETGVTVHEMIEEFDAGRIVAQERVCIAPGTSVLFLFSTQCRLAAGMLRQSVDEALARGSIEGEAQDPSLRSYRREPTRRDIARLHANGFALMHPDDLPSLLPRLPRVFTSPGPSHAK